MELDKGRTASGSERTFGTAVSKNETGDRAIIFRYVDVFERGFDRALYPDRVILVWRYSSETGMPAHAERGRMDNLEDLLGPHVEASGSAVLVLVSTGNDLREWTYYAKSEAAFLAQLNTALREQTAFPIEIHVGPDPRWSTYDGFRRGVTS